MAFAFIMPINPALGLCCLMFAYMFRDDEEEQK